MRSIGRIRPCACSVSLLDRGNGGFLYAGTGYLLYSVIASAAKRSPLRWRLPRGSAPRSRGDCFGTLRLAMTATPPHPYPLPPHRGGREIMHYSSIIFVEFSILTQRFKGCDER